MTITWGVEMHSHSLRNDYFLRLVLAEETVYSRWGTRGEAGTLRAETFASEFAAEDEMVSRITGSELRNYKRAYSGMRGDVVVPVRPHGDLATGELVEAVFLDQWARAARASVGWVAEPWMGDAPPTDQASVHEIQWVLFTGLVGEVGKDHGAGVILECLTARPHAVDIGNDRLLGQVSTAVDTGTGVLPPGVMDSLLRPFPPRVVQRVPVAPAAVGCIHSSTSCVRCSAREAELLLHLAVERNVNQYDSANRVRLGEAVRRLVALTEGRRAAT